MQFFSRKGLTTTLSPILDNDSLRQLVLMGSRSQLIAFISVMYSALRPVASHSDVTCELSGLAGWTIATVTQVEGEFEGCGFNKKIEFINGMSLECSTYSYTYLYAPAAVIFFRVEKYKNQDSI